LPGVLKIDCAVYRGARHFHVGPQRSSSTLSF
jgi:hypothetical protein